MKANFLSSRELRERAYVGAIPVGGCAGTFAAFFLFALIPHWYIALPAALFGWWATVTLCVLLSYQLRETLTCPNLFHRILSGIILIIAIPVGLIAFYLIPNWEDFDFNGHSSLLAVFGSVAMGVVSFTLASGMVGFLGAIFRIFLLRFLARDKHTYTGK